MTKPSFAIEPLEWTVRELARMNPTGYVGPCDSAECPSSATKKIAISVNDIQTVAWVCDHHFEEVTA